MERKARHESSIMWDFSFGKAIGMVARTAPFVVLRLLVYFGIGFAYLVAVGAGGVIGYGFGHLGSSPDAPDTAAFWGGLIGFGLVSAILYFAREYILYLVKAAHIAVLVELLDGKDVPAGQGQISYGAAFVKTHFAQSSVLFGVDQLIKGVLAAFFRTINFFTAFLPIPALQQMIRIAEAVVRMSLTYVDEIILAHLIRTRTTNPWDTAKDGLILYAQNYKHFLKNAAWLSGFIWALTIFVFLVIVGPFAALAAVLHGGFLWTIALAFIFAWALKASLLEPVAIASLMQVYFKTIEGQTPNPEWDARLSQASAKFRALGEKAASWVPGPKLPEPKAP
ncbi:MAG TPA: hypothetical protein VG889_00250 [Rhizomicrobium sp.]|nr:hypothetical protein [Rhizomicrobium sp.]